MSFRDFQMLIDAKNPKGKRINVSIDDTLYALFKIQCEKSRNKNPAQIIKSKIKKGTILNSLSARTFIILQIAKPSLVDQFIFEREEYQTDIEDLI